MFPLKAEEIAALSEENLDELCRLDALGLLLGDEEDIVLYRERLTALEAEISRLAAELADGGERELFRGAFARADHAISTEILDEAGDLTEKAYAFRVNWVPGFFLSQSLGWLWGGCAAVFDSGLRVFLVRAAFATRRKWLIYRRDELLAHELCHVARAALNDLTAEEDFAYRLSFSRFRAWMGPCFREPRDAILFLAPVAVLLVASLLDAFELARCRMGFFWALAGVYPAFLLIRNILARRNFRDAENVALLFFANAAAALFRCSYREIRQLAAFAGDPSAAAVFIRRRADENLRWRVILRRFLRKEGPAENPDFNTRKNDCNFANGD